MGNGLIMFGYGLDLSEAKPHLSALVSNQET